MGRCLAAGTSKNCVRWGSMALLFLWRKTQALSAVRRSSLSRVTKVDFVPHLEAVKTAC